LYTFRRYGNPFFTTDTAAALRAVEIGADVLLKGTRVMESILQILKKILMPGNLIISLSRR